MQQKHEHGCLIACVAMVLGWDYDQVSAHFIEDFSKRGTTSAYAKRFLCEHGFSVIEKIGSGYINALDHNKRMLEPFAPIHIIGVQQFIDRPKQYHAFVTDSKGKIYDPHDEKCTSMTFYEAVSAMGFWQT